MKSMHLRAAAVAICGALLAQGLTASQGNAPNSVPSIVYGIWIWSADSKIDPALGRYKCYVERLDHVENGKSRLREHRIRESGVFIKNDFQFEFGTELPVGNGAVVLFKLIGPRSYQIIGGFRAGRRF